MIRIDEDCFIEFNIDKIFEQLKSNKIITGKIEKDHDYVTRGMNEFTLEFMQENIDPNYTFMFDTPIGPYTNVFGLNLVILKQRTELKEFVRAVENSNRIYTHRWGDMSLWGQVAEHILEKNSLIVLPIRYIHKSHSVMIN
jgi:hypothetical protein